MRGRSASTVLGAGLGSVLGAVLATALYAVPAAAQDADAQGWWTVLHRDGAPPPPSPPDVADDDLLLQGGDPGRILPPGLVDDAPAPSALAALRFTVGLGAGVGPLVLAVGAGAQAADVRAYATAADWQPVQGGPAEQAPAPDLSRYSAGVLSVDATTLVFGDIGRLVDEVGRLSVVLVPGPADRVVVHPPAATALAVTPARAAPVAPAAVPPPLLPRAAPAAVVARVEPVLAPPPAVASPPPAALAPPATAVPRPQTAAVVAPVSAPAAVTRRVADDARTRLFVVAEAVLLVVFSGLLGLGPLRRLSRLTGEAPAVRPERGVGRHTAVRSGLPPRL